MNNSSPSTHVIISGLLLLILLLAWVGTMILSPFGGSPQDQLQQVFMNWRTYQISFVIALFIAPAYLYFMFSLLRLDETEIGIYTAAGLTIACFYLVCATIAYGAQVTLVPYYLNRGQLLMAQYWFFFDNHSISYYINQTGYALWSMSALFLFTGMVGKKGIARVIGFLFVLSASLSLVAYAGLIFKFPALNLMTIPSGMLTIPISLFSIMLAAKKTTREKEEQVIE
jgi:hypothetical protein